MFYLKSALFSGFHVQLVRFAHLVRIVYLLVCLSLSVLYRQQRDNQHQAEQEQLDHQQQDQQGQQQQQQQWLRLVMFISAGS